MKNLVSMYECLIFKDIGVVMTVDDVLKRSYIYSKDRKLSDDEQAVFKELEANMFGAMLLINDHFPDCKEKENAIRSLHEGMLWAREVVRLHGLPVLDSI